MMFPEATTHSACYEMFSRWAALNNWFAITSFAAGKNRTVVWAAPSGQFVAVTFNPETDKITHLSNPLSK